MISFYKNSVFFSFVGASGDYKDIIKLFESEKYGRMNLMFTDDTLNLVDVGARDTYYSWAGEYCSEGQDPMLLACWYP